MLIRMAAKLPKNEENSDGSFALLCLYVRIGFIIILRFLKLLLLGKKRTAKSASDESEVGR